MNYKLIKFISGRIAHSTRRERFLNFARGVAFTSVLLGSMALIISLSALKGFETELRDKAVTFTSHISIRNATFKPIEKAPKIEGLARQFDFIKKVAPVLSREGLIRTDMYVEGALIRAMDSGLDINNIEDKIVDGSFSFLNDSSYGVLIGESLSRKLGAGIGDTVVLFALRKDAEGDFFPEIDKFIVSAIYRTGMSKYDDIVAYIPHKIAPGFFKTEHGFYNSYEVIVSDINKVDIYSSKIEEYLGFPYFSRTVFELHSSIFAWIELQKAPIPLVLGLISIVAVFNIVTILLITVVEKTYSIGILRAVGMPNKDILALFVFQGTSIGALGALSGCGIGFALGFLQNQFSIIKLNPEIYFIDTFPIAFDPLHFLIVFGASAFLSFIASLAPSLIAVRIKPITAIRFK